MTYMGEKTQKNFTLDTSTAESLDALQVRISAIMRRNVLGAELAEVAFAWLLSLRDGEISKKVTERWSALAQAGTLEDGDDDADSAESSEEKGRGGSRRKGRG